MVSIIVRGRAAWIAAMALGIVLLAIGGATGPGIPLMVAGGAFLLFGTAMLIASLVTGGRSD